MALSTKANKALASLNNQARIAQRNGEVMMSRQILEHARGLREELERLTRDFERCFTELEKLKSDHAKLQEELEEDWPIPAGVDFLPSDVRTTAW